MPKLNLMQPGTFFQQLECITSKNRLIGTQHGKGFKYCNEITKHETFSVLPTCPIDIGQFFCHSGSKWDNSFMEAIISAWRRWRSQRIINFNWHWMDNISECIYRRTVAGLAGIKGIKTGLLFTAEAYYPTTPQRETENDIVSVCLRKRKRK